MSPCSMHSQKLDGMKILNEWLNTHSEYIKIERNLWKRSIHRINWYLLTTCQCTNVVQQRSFVGQNLREAMKMNDMETVFPLQSNYLVILDHHRHMYVRGVTIVWFWWPKDHSIIFSILDMSIHCTFLFLSDRVITLTSLAKNYGVPMSLNCLHWFPQNLNLRKQHFAPLSSVNL